MPRWEQPLTAVSRGLPAVAIVWTVLAGCSAEPARTTPRETPRTEASQRVETPVSEAAPGPPAYVSLDDPAGDLAALDGTPVSGPAHMDALRVEASVEGDSLQVTLRLAGNPPTGVDGSVEQINYLVIIDTDGPQEMDYWLTAENRSSGEYAYALTDYSIGYNYDSENDEFPGSATVADDLVLWRIPLAALGDPSSMRLSIWTQASLDFEPYAEDYIPDAASDLSADSAAWVVVLP